MDTPSPVTPLFIHTYSAQFGQNNMRVMGPSTVSSKTWAGANLSTFLPFTLPWYYNAQRAFWMNGSAVGGNANIGIFTQGGVRLWSIGSTVTSGASVLQYVTISPDLWLPPGSYYLAIAFSGTTNVVSGGGPTAALMKLSGNLIQTGNLALATPATFATNTTNVLAFCGLTKTSAGF